MKNMKKLKKYDFLKNHEKKKKKEKDQRLT
jgi:hypothetical protein